MADAPHGAQVTVAYRQNRVVIFNSDLFHETAPFKFRKGYTNRRINLTMLFGDRGATARANANANKV
jgi:hypothetical protein